MGAATFFAVMALSTSARASDKFEIQVYQGEHNDPGQFGLEVHTNYTFAGHKTPAYEGETPADRALRITLEPSLGITDWLEVGAYLQTMVSPGSNGEFAGWKLRVKVVAPDRWKLPVRLGLNAELGRVPRSVEEEGWANELRPIIGFHWWRFGLTFNPLIGFPLTGPDAGKPDFEPATKLKFNTNLGFAVGAEYYAGLGRFDVGFDPLHKQEHLLFAVFDLEPRVGAPEPSDAWELNVDLGAGLTSATAQQWLAKVIVGHAF
jgi:hypothetical protein